MNTDYDSPNIVQMNTDSRVKPWSLLKKMVFRFLFVFFALEIFATIDFIFIGFGLPMSLIVWSQETFTPPFLWLNNHIFHFNYNPYQWFTFTYSLLLIRFITFITVALIACAVWTFADRRRTGYDKPDFWMRQFLCFSLSCIMWSYGIDKIFPVQMQMPDLTDLHTPIGDLSPFSLLWITLGYGVPYQMFTGVGEALGAVLILFRRTRPVGLLLLCMILVNIVVLNYTYFIGVLGLSSFLLLIAVYLVFPYLKNLWRFFFTDELVNQFNRLPQYRLTEKWKKYTVVVITVLLVTGSYLISFKKVYTRYGKNVAKSESGRYSEVKRFVLNADTLEALVEGDTARWRFWEEDISKNEVTVHMIDNKVSKVYSLNRDSLLHTITLKPAGEKDSVSFVLSYHDVDSVYWHLEGSIEGRLVAADLQKTDPYTTMKLFRIKRQFFETDPEEHPW